MRLRFIAGVLLAVTLVGQAHAQTTPDKFSGKNMLKFCKADATPQPTSADYSRGVCAGTVYAVFSLSNFIHDPDQKFCPPKTADVGQAIRMVVAYLEARPDMQDANIVLLALLIMHQTWPCPS